MALVALACGAALAAALLRSANPRPAVLTLIALTAAVFVVQDIAAWSWRLEAVRAVRADRSRDLRWLDHAAGGPVARIVVAANAPSGALTEFFNRDLTQVYVPAPEIGAVSGAVIHGRTCSWNVGPDGTLILAPGCGPTPRRFVLDDEVARLTLAGQRVLADDPHGGRVVDVGRAAPRALALVFVPCGPRGFRAVLDADGVPHKQRSAACTQDIHGNLWLDAPGRLELRFQGGTTAQQIVAAGRTSLIAPGTSTTVPVEVPGQPTSFTFQLSWAGDDPGLPRLVGVDLVRGGVRTDLIGSLR